jgi:hypothetical protein
MSESVRNLNERNIAGLNYKPTFVHARTFPILGLYSVPHAYCWNVDDEIPAQFEDQRDNISWYWFTNPSKEM